MRMRGLANCMTYSLPNTTLRRITAILCRESSRFVPRRKILREIDQSIFALLEAIGGKTSHTEYAVAFREAVDAVPTPWQRAEEFRRIAVAENPISPDVCSSGALVRLNAQARERWSEFLEFLPLGRTYHLIRVDWNDFCLLYTSDAADE